MKEKAIRGIRRDKNVRRFENDYDYPWDERYTLDIRGVDSIKRCIGIDGYTASGRSSKKY